MSWVTFRPQGKDGFACHKSEGLCDSLIYSTKAQLPARRRILEFFWKNNHRNPQVTTESNMNMLDSLITRTKMVDSLLGGEYWKPEYMTSVFNEFMESLSVILATYNRCPFDPAKSDLNPLIWCLDSLLNQSLPRIEELIFIDDASNDYTVAVIEKYENLFQQRGMKTQIIRHSDRLEMHESRNKGAKRAQCRLLYFIDDDCILPPFALAGLISTYIMAERSESELGVLTGPIYQRATKPVNQYAKEKIYNFGTGDGIVTGNYDGFPLEFLSGENVFESNGLMKTLSAQHMSEGHTIINRNKLLKAGGFRTMPPRSYGGGAGLSFAMMALGATLRYSPDPRIHAVHLRYGNEFGRKRLLGLDWNISGKVTLAQMVKEAKKKQRNTGCRVEPEIWHYAKIRNYALVFLEFRSELVDKWWAFTYKTFVEENQGGVMGSLQDRKLREKIWQMAKDDALARRFDTSESQLSKRLQDKPQTQPSI